MIELEKKKTSASFSKKQSNIFIIVVVLFAFLVVTGVFLSKNLRGTYSARTIQFRGDTNYSLNNYPGYDGPDDGICYTDEYGFLDPNCVYKVGCTCRRWSHSVSVPGTNNQSTALESSELYTHVFTGDETYYCVSGSSYTSDCDIYPATTDCYRCTKNNETIYQSAINVTRAKAYAGTDDCDADPVDEAYCNPQPEPEYACYQCSANATVFRWGVNGDGDANCSGGYTKTTLSQANCVYVAPPEYACYQCSADATVFRWGVNGDGDANCSGGYTKTTLSQANCVYVAPPEYACYQCIVDETIFKWTTSGTGDSNCTSGYNKTTLSEANCKYVAPEPEYACYQCSANDKVFKWTTGTTGDSECLGGYTKTTKTKAECKYEEVIENPKTGTAAIIGAWIIAVMALGYSIIYVFKNKKVDE